MAATVQVLTQDGERLVEPDGGLGSTDRSIKWRTLQGGSDWSVNWATLRGGLSEGVETVTLSNGTLSVTVCPTRGMGILHAECDGIPIGWKSPVPAPVHPQFVDLQARNRLGWLDGFSELLCRCGLASNGPPGIDEGAKSPIESDLTLHGRIANIPAHFVSVEFDEDTGRMCLVGECRESTLFGPHLTLRSTVSLFVNATQFQVEDAVTNHAATDAEMQLLYHINVGPPFLEEGAQFLTSFQAMSPRDARAAHGVDSYAQYLGPTTGYAEQVYFFDTIPDENGQACALLRNRSGNLGLSLKYDRRQLPCLSQWKCTQAEADGYVTGIEPGTNFPNFKSLERQQGRVVSLPSGGTYTTSLTFDVHTGAAGVMGVSEWIAARQAGIEAVTHREPTQPFAAP